MESQPPSRPIKQTVNSLTCSDRDIQHRTVVQFNNNQLSFTGRLYTGDRLSIHKSTRPMVPFDFDDFQNLRSDNYKMSINSLYPPYAVP